MFDIDNLFPFIEGRCDLCNRYTLSDSIISKINQMGKFMQRKVVTVSGFPDVHLYNKGKIAQRGTHAELINHRDGQYRKLFALETQ